MILGVLLMVSPASLYDVKIGESEHELIVKRVGETVKQPTSCMII